LSRSEVPAEIVRLRKPYLLFVGRAASEADAKTALGIRDWSRESCLAQLRLEGAQVDLGLPEMTPEIAAQSGARSLVIGVAPVGGKIPGDWHDVILRAAAAGLDIVSGMHHPLAAIPNLAATAARAGAALVDVRLSNREYPIATGRKRLGKRLLTVGTDCALGKKYTALALARAMRATGMSVDFRATGQTGILISGSGIAIDAVVGDFAAGAAEMLSPDAAPDHWDVIEGQGSLFHPAYAGVSLALLHGSQPDVMVLCHDPSRLRLNAFPHYAVPELTDAVSRYSEAARLTNRGARVAAISLNTSMLRPTARSAVLAETGAKLHLPCFDPMVSCLDEVIDAIGFDDGRVHSDS
jgi:uncharacterized NAD-dependent epimerase/dehydratase family protein